MTSDSKYPSGAEKRKLKHKLLQGASQMFEVLSCLLWTMDVELFYQKSRKMFLVCAAKTGYQ
jgi:hypothetical protein